MIDFIFGDGIHEPEGTEVRLLLGRITRGYLPGTKGFMIIMIQGTHQWSRASGEAVLCAIGGLQLALGNVALKAPGQRLNAVDTSNEGPRNEIE